MTETTGYVVKSGDPAKPYKVIFRAGEKVIAEHAVTSRRAGQELIDRLLPTLQGFDPDA